MVPLERTVSLPLTVPLTTLDAMSLSFEGSLSLIEYVTGENVGFVAVSVHDVVSPTCSAVGSQALVKVTARLAPDDRDRHVKDAVSALRLLQRDRAEARLAERDRTGVHRDVEGGVCRWARP